MAYGIFIVQYLTRSTTAKKAGTNYFSVLNAKFFAGIRSAQTFCYKHATDKEMVIFKLTKYDEVLVDFGVKLNSIGGCDRTSDCNLLAFNQIWPYCIELRLKGGVCVLRTFDSEKSQKRALKYYISKKKSGIGAKATPYGDKLPIIGIYPYKSGSCEYDGEY